MFAGEISIYIYPSLWVIISINEISSRQIIQNTTRCFDRIPVICVVVGPAHAAMPPLGKYMD